MKGQPSAPASQELVWASLAERASQLFGTPCYVVRWTPVAALAARLEARFSPLPLRQWLSFKTHPVPPLARAWIAAGRGVEVVSEYEYATVRDLQCPVDQLLVNGVAKHTWLGRHQVPGLRVHFDSVREVRELLPQAVRDRWRVGLRCHVPSECDGPGSTFGGQFGLADDELGEAHQLLQMAGVRVEGLHFHLGPGAAQRGAYRQAVDYIVACCERHGIVPRYIDCGGGLEPSEAGEAALDELVEAVDAAAMRLPFEEVWSENGRFITSTSTALVVRVIDAKVRDECRYVICDGGRTNQALAADHGLHPMLLLPPRSGPDVLTTVTGPTCMTDDRLGRVMLPERLAPGDHVVWLNAGAYHLPWETRFSQGLCAVVWCDEADAMTLARQRETVEEWARLWTGEREGRS